MKKSATLTQHPRLLFTSDHISHLSQPLDHPFHQTLNKLYRRQVRRYLTAGPIDCQFNHHNAHLVRGRLMQCRMVYLLTEWQRTQKESIRTLILDNLRRMNQWEYWSWITWRVNDNRPDAIFDLSYGENAATLALAYDWLHPTLTAQEKAELIAMANHWVFASAKKNCLGKNKPWWFAKPDSNWNTVCAGGLGTLCLAMLDDVPIAAKLLEKVQQSFRPYFAAIQANHGGWPEGLGYWNYGMRYAFWYLLSWENTFNQSHPLMAIPEVKRTLEFPLDFCPHGHACGFGDSNRWKPLPFHYLVAQKLKQRQTTQRLEAALLQMDQTHLATAAWPAIPLWLLTQPSMTAKPKISSKPTHIKHYRNIDWAVLTDDIANPGLYLAIRGGTTCVPHHHNDLMSYHAVINGERLIDNIGITEYLDTTFSNRRNELYEVSPFSKNTLLINGLGVAPGTALESTQTFSRKNLHAVRLDATPTMNVGNEVMVGKKTVSAMNASITFLGRIFILLKQSAILIIDRAELAHVGRLENRTFTHAQTKLTKTSVQLHRNKARARLTFAANVPAVLQTSNPILTNPNDPQPTLLRWASCALHTDTVFATLITPGNRAASVTVKSTDKKIRITAAWNSTTQTVTLTPDLHLA